MPNVQIRDVPDDVHRELVRRARLTGQSLQSYLSDQLTTIVEMPTVEEVVARIERRQLGRLTSAEAVEALDDERARR